MGSAPEGSGKGTFFQKSFPPQGVLFNAHPALKQPPEPGAERGEVPGAVGFPVFFKPDDIAFKQGKVARKLFAPGIGEGRHARQFVLDGPCGGA